MLSFIKMHGLGNDFIVLDERKGERAGPAPELSPEQARKLCDRRFGIGADQILRIRPARGAKAIAAMEVVNADGSRAEMCGNGIRAVALYLHGELPADKRQRAYLIETGAGDLTVEVTETPAGCLARVEMGIPRVGEAPEKLKLGSEVSVEFLEVSLGNPHAVVFVKNAWDYPVEEQGPAIETHPRFAERTNVEFVHIEHAKPVQEAERLVVRVWERGAGLTLACGTGASAAAVAAIALGKCQSPVEVKLPGGSLQLEWAGKGQPAFMSGPAVEVFRGQLSVNYPWSIAD